MKRFLVAAVLSCLSLAAVSAHEMGFIKARGCPGNAGVWVDGKYIGRASRFTVPEKYEVEAGEHEITLREPRYEDYTTKVTVQPGKTTKVSYKMTKRPVPQPPFGRLRMSGGMAQSFISASPPRKVSGPV